MYMGSIFPSSFFLLIFQIQPYLLNPNNYMGNTITYRPSNATGKIVLCDGRVEEFDKPLAVAELMLEHPQQVVVDFKSAMNQKRPTPLPADKMLEMNEIYLMLPIKRGKPSVLTSEETRRILLIVNSFLRNSSSTRILPWFARVCPAVGTFNGEAHKEKPLEQKREGKEVLSMLNLEIDCDVLGGRPEYLSRQISGKGWKPSLDTIEEKNVQKKKLVHLFLKRVRAFNIQLNL